MSFHRSILLLSLACASAVAQEPPQPVPTPVTPAPIPGRPGVPTPPGARVPGAPAANPAGAPTGVPATGRVAAEDNAKVVPGIPLGENKIVEDIVEPKLSGIQLAGLYRVYTGRRVIVSTAAAAAEFSFVQDASKENPLTFAKAAELLKKAALIENFVFVPDVNDKNLDILTLATGGARPTQIGIAVYNENDPLPDGDEVISYVMTLSYIKPAEAVNTFTQIIGQFGAYGSIAAVPNASAVVITENTSLIRKLIDLKKEIDKPGSVQATRFIKVQYADVTEIANTLTDLLTAQASTQKTAGVQRAEGAAPAPAPGAPVAPGGAPSAGSAGEDTPVQIVPEPRTNRIFAMGRPVDLLFVEGLVREFDIPTSDKTFLRRKLHFLTVSDFLPIAGDALNRAFSSGDGGGGSSGSSAAGGASGSRSSSSRSSGSSSSGSSGSTGSRSSSSHTSGFGSSSSGFGSSSSGFGGSSSGYGGSSSGMGGSSSGMGAGGGSALNDPNYSSAPESLLVGRTLLVADNITNSIVAQGPPSGLEIIERLLDQLDVKPDQVMISTVIGQLTYDNSHETGVSYLYRGNRLNGGGGGGFPDLLPILKNVASGTTTGGTGTTTTTAAQLLDPGSFGGSGLTALGRIDNLNIFLKALQSKTDFTVLSRPSIFTSNNVKGTISSGERIAIPTSTNSFGTTGNSSTNIEYQDVVLKLEVIPLVNSDSEITMQIALLNDEQNGTQTIEGAGSNGGPLTVPKISTRTLLTNATVPNNQTIVLGGLIIGRNNQTKSGIPILSDIPYLGRLFSDVVDDKSRSELMVFIQPSIIRGDHSLNDLQTDTHNRYKVAPDALKFADGDTLPPAPTVNEKGRISPASTATSTVKPTLSAPHHN